LQDAKRLFAEGQFDIALEKTNSIIQNNPKIPDAFILRGNIYAQQKKWGLAESDYTTALQIDPANFTAKFNLGEVKFRQKKYDSARADFAVLVNVPDDGDLAAYKVFLCDLIGGHETAAKKELDAFNIVAANPSYYFGNVAWSLVHQNTEDARRWLSSAVEIYAPRKVILYGSSLKELGYLPLPKKPDL
jgi:tetratricopeptide (TPR) repeat protein